MNQEMLYAGSRRFYLGIAVLQLAFSALVLIPPYISLIPPYDLVLKLARQTLGFAYLSFVPGIVLLSILGWREQRISETLVYSFGLSISFLMGFGLFANTFLPLFGISQPLATIPLTLTLSAVVLGLCLYGIFRSSGEPMPYLDLSAVGIKSIPLFLLLLFLPLLSVYGTWVMNAVGDNTLLIADLLLIALWVALLVAFSRWMPSPVYPFALLMISASILLMLSLRSNYVVGWDINRERFICLYTLENLRWSSAYSQDPYNSCLSITVLPVMLVSLLGIELDQFFKLLGPLIFSATPAVLYILYSRYLNTIPAFLAAFYFMSVTPFIEMMPEIIRNAVALFFFSLALLLLFDEDQSPPKEFLFVTFSISVVFSHYSTAYIFFILLVSMRLLSSLVSPEIIKPREGITYITVVLLVVFTFFWQGLITGGPIYGLVHFADNFIRSLHEFSSPLAREGSAKALGAGVAVVRSGQWLVSLIGLVLRIFTIIGALYVFINYRRQRFNINYLLMSVLALGILIAVVFLPFGGYNLERVYIQVLVLLAPMTVIGISLVFQRPLAALKTPAATLLIIASFISCTGLIFQYFGYPYSLSLNNAGTYYERIFIEDQDYFAIQWLSHNDAELVFADAGGIDRLGSYGGFRDRNLYRWLYHKQYTKHHASEILIYGDWVASVPHDSFAFLRKLNIKFNKFSETWLTPTNVSHIYLEKDLIYNNGGAEVYY